MSRLALALWCLFAAGCIRTQRLPPPSYEGMSLAGFAASLGWEAEDREDPFLEATTVRVTPRPGFFDFMGDSERGYQDSVDEFQKRQVQGALAQFERWCRETGGSQAYEAQSRFAATVREWVDSYARRNNNKYRPNPSSGVCTGKGGAVLAAYVNIDNVEIAFHDEAGARAFMDRFATAVDLTEGEKRARAQAEETRAEREDPHPEQEAARARLVKQLAAVIDPDIPGRLGAHFEYISHCRIRLWGEDSTAVISLRHLDHARLTNVSWIDLGALAAYGTLYHIVLADDGGAHRMTTNDLEVARQVVHGFEDLGRSCGAW